MLQLVYRAAQAAINRRGWLSNRASMDQKSPGNVNIGRAEDLWAALEGVIAGDVLNRFESFVAQNPTKGWIIGSDYVIGDKTRPHDCLCFTVYPIYEHEPLKHWQEIAEAIPQDLKKTRRIDEKIVSCLRDRRRFSFCFIVTKERNPNVDRDVAKAAIDRNLEIMLRWEDADKHDHYIKRMQRLRQHAQAKAFKAHLFADMFLVTNIVTVIGYLITKLASPRIIGWFFDRDSITSAYGGVAKDLFAINHSAICQQRGVPYQGVQLGLGNPLPDPQSPNQSWYDPIVRIPDFLAGTLAAFNYRTRTFEGGKQKIPDLLTKVFSDAPNIAIIIFEKIDDRIMPFTMTMAPMLSPACLTSART
jgi:hypothetical protein